MNERTIKERQRDTWLMVAGTLLIVLLVAGLVLLPPQLSPVAAPTPTNR